MLDMVWSMRWSADAVQYEVRGVVQHKKCFGDSTEDSFTFIRSSLAKNHSYSHQVFWTDQYQVAEGDNQT